LPIKSLWPDDIGESDLVTPVSIMREQAALLGERTENLVTAEVVTAANGPFIIHNFILEAPALSYRYQLFSADHQVSLYPVDVNYNKTTTRCTDEAQFRQKLGQILGADATKQIVRALKAQSRG
jgi:hypothetical protein